MLHVLFTVEGMLYVTGMDVVKKIEDVGSQSGRPSVNVTITASGVTEESKQ